MSDKLKQAQQRKIIDNQDTINQWWRQKYPTLAAQGWRITDEPEAHRVAPRGDDFFGMTGKRGN